MILLVEAVFAVFDSISVDMFIVILVVSTGELVVLKMVERNVNSGEEDVLKIEDISDALLIFLIVVPLWEFVILIDVKRDASSEVKVVLEIDAMSVDDVSGKEVDEFILICLVVIRS